MIEIEVDTRYVIQEPEEDPQAAKNELEKQRENIRTILLCTNATPLGRYTSLGYNCCFCNEQYLEPRQLKTHTKDRHDDEIMSFMHSHTMLNYIVKLDITGLRCDICMTRISELRDIVHHLTVVHEKFFHTDITNHIVPFRFDSEKLRCVDCPLEYNNFKILLEHMNTHYSNHTCGVCEAGFVNKRMLQAHMYRHKTGVFQCGFCTKIFDTRINMKVHERMCIKKRASCNICETRFADFDEKMEHDEHEHGLERKYLCDLCDRKFTDRRALKIHNKYYCNE